MHYITLEEIKDKLDFFRAMYDEVRLVDPLHKRVLEYRRSDLLNTPKVCYDYWENSKICDNCISIRAYYDKKSYMKMEKLGNSLVLVTAFPIENSAVPAVLELLKDTTETMLIGDGDYNKGEMFTHFVERLNDAIIKDSLTLLYNRRFIDERLPVAVIEAALHQVPLSLGFIDLDNFKQVNDIYGHTAGDFAIKALGEILLNNVGGAGAWAARYGGDEFLLCLYGKGESESRALLEKIQDEIKEISFGKQNGDIKIGVSFGISTMGQDLMTPEELIKAADENMYKAKRKKTF